MYLPTEQKSRIMVIDDDSGVMSLLENILYKNGYSVLPFLDVSKALETAHKEAPDLILMDIAMPEMDGFLACERFKQNSVLKDIPVIFMSGKNTTEDKIKGFQAGGVDYITKPFHPMELNARIKTHLDLSTLRNKLKYEKLMEKKIQDVAEAQQATIFALAKLAEQRDDNTGSHLERVREYCKLLAKQLSEDSTYSDRISEDFIICIQHASPLHDIGKVAIPDSILLKPGKLSFEEFEVMKSHCIIGAENMQAVFNKYPDNAFIGMGIEIALYHHERWDGSGYPDRLIGKNIPLPARIMAVADCYDALRSDRCYRNGFNHELVISMIQGDSGTHFDPEIVRCFMSIESMFRSVFY